MQNVNEIMETQETKKKNKGFSLVELIIVIAIMAILVGVVGTQVLPYIEKSRIARDQQVMSALATSALTTFAQNAGDLTTTATYTISSSNDTTFAVSATSGATIPVTIQSDFIALSAWDSFTAVRNAFSSNAASGATGITITYAAATGVVTVTATGVTDLQLSPITVQ